MQTTHSDNAKIKNGWMDPLAFCEEDSALDTLSFIFTNCYMLLQIHFPLGKTSSICMFRITQWERKRAILGEFGVPGESVISQPLQLHPTSTHCLDSVSAFIPLHMRHGTRRSICVNWQSALDPGHTKCPPEPLFRLFNYHQHQQTHLYRML